MLSEPMLSELNGSRIFSGERSQSMVSITVWILNILLFEIMVGTIKTQLFQCLNRELPIDVPNARC